MDPQQRLLLESSFCSLTQQANPHRAVDMGNTSLSGLTLSSTISLAEQNPDRSLPSPGHVGVYIGISYNEYGPAAGSVMGAVSTYTATGSSLSVAAGILM